MNKKTKFPKQRFYRLYWHKIKIFLLFLGSLILVTSLYWWIFLSDFFQIKNIIILGGENEKELEEALNAYFYQKNQKWVPASLWQLFPTVKNNYRNLLLFSSNESSTYLMQKFPILDHLDFHLDLKSGDLTVQVFPRQVAFIVCLDNKKCYYLDKNGMIFSEAPETSGSLINTIWLHQTSALEIKTQLFSPQNIAFLQSLFDFSQRPDSPFKIKIIELNQQQTSTLNILTNENWYLKINFDSNLPQIVQIIQKLKEGELKNKTSLLSYIDCRFLPKVYYKMK